MNYIGFLVAVNSAHNIIERLRTKKVYTMSENKVEGKLTHPLQIYTLAHARRKNLDKEKVIGMPLEKKTSMSYSEEIASQVREALKQKPNTASTQRQPLSNLPMKMIVSKMATRKRIQPKENNNSHEGVDFSTYRHFKLAPPPWRDKQHQTRRRRPTVFEKMVEEMREKCAQFDTNKRCNATIQSQRGRKMNLAKLIADEKSDSWSTPRLQYDYDQLYGKHHKIEEQEKPMIYDTEDPLDFSTTNPIAHRANPVERAHRVEQSPEEAAHHEFQSCSPVHQGPGQEFVWNPVIVSEVPKEDLFSILKGSDDNFQRPVTESFPEYGPELVDYRCHSNNEQHSDNDYGLGFHEYQQYKTQNVHLESEYGGEDSNHHLVHYDSPQSPWECSSTSSGQTIAEERLQLTYYAKKKPQKRPMMSPPSPEFLKTLNTMWSSSLPCFNFCEE